MPADDDFKTDYSSDPIGLLDWSKVDVAGVVHDYLYRDPGTTRWQADWIWFKIARSGKWKCSLLTACLGWLGMRLFGWMFRSASTIFRKVMDCVICVPTAIVLLWLLLILIQGIFDGAIQIFAWVAGLSEPPELGVKAFVVVVVVIRLAAAAVRSRQRRRLNEADAGNAG